MLKCAQSTNDKHTFFISDRCNLLGITVMNNIKLKYLLAKRTLTFVNIKK